MVRDAHIRQHALRRLGNSAPQNAASDFDSASLCLDICGAEGIPDMTVTIYGIKNCDTMKKARAWLDGHGVKYEFHDYKSEGIAREKLKAWSDKLGWETLFNRAGTTFRKLPDEQKDGLNEKKALALMLEQPSMIKRPVLEAGAKLLVGFAAEIYAKEVKAAR
jgi:arsenate reductase (glutaredoxin)